MYLPLASGKLCASVNKNLRQSRVHESLICCPEPSKVMALCSLLASFTLRGAVSGFEIIFPARGCYASYTLGSGYTKVHAPMCCSEDSHRHPHGLYTKCICHMHNTYLHTKAPTYIFFTWLPCFAWLTPPDVQASAYIALLWRNLR